MTEPPLPAANPATPPGTELTGGPARERRTGNAEVDAALDRLAALADAPLGDQVPGYDDVHRRLTAALGPGLPDPGKR